jgi:FAD/FMN-containing dehydrogenase
MIDQLIISEMQASLTGDLHLPGTTGFDTARVVWNAIIDRHPAAIVHCRTEADVATALAAARKAGTSVSVRGGGHNIGGTAVADNALMIDMSGMRTVAVDATNRVAHVQGGATWAELDAATQAHGLAAPGGVVSSTGIAGLTLGGGFGWLSRKHGLAVDNLIEVRLVLASGRTVTASETSHADLFWAIRGGSGNFGVAIRFSFRLHPVGPQVLFGPTFFNLTDARTVLSAYATHAPKLPRETCVWANLMMAPPVPLLPAELHGKPILNLTQFHSGEAEEGRSVLESLHGGVQPLGSGLAERPFVEAQACLDTAYEFGARNYWRAHNHLELSPAMIDVMVAQAMHLPTPESEILICQLGGAIADVAESGTAFPHRRVRFVSTPGVRWRDAADDDRVIGWLTDLSGKLAPHAVPGTYVNFIAETNGRAADAYGANLARLSRIKLQYDPDNLFCANQNVRPAP